MRKKFTIGICRLLDAADDLFGSSDSTQSVSFGKQTLSDGSHIGQVGKSKLYSPLRAGEESVAYQIDSNSAQTTRGLISYNKPS